MFNPTLYRMLTIGWMTLTFLLSAQPTLSTPPLFWGWDKLAHAAFYGVLCMFLARSFVPTRVATWKRVFLLTILVTAYGVTDEYHQSFVPGRHASAGDVLADGIGGFVVAWIMYARRRRVASFA